MTMRLLGSSWLRVRLVTILPSSAANARNGGPYTRAASPTSRGLQPEQRVADPLVQRRARPAAAGGALRDDRREQFGFPLLVRAVPGAPQHPADHRRVEARQQRPHVV